MADTETTETTAADTSSGADETPKALREALKRAQDEAKAAREEANSYRVRALEAAFKEAGLDPSKGVGKAVAKEYSGDADAEAIKSYAAEEYGWEPPVAENPIAADVRDAQNRVGAVTSDAVSTPTTLIDQQITEAERAGDFATAIALKVQRHRAEIGR